MANQNPLAGVVPQVIHPRIDGETAVTEYIEKIEGEVALDSYVKAQTSAPEVVKRITMNWRTAYSVWPMLLWLLETSISVRNCAPPPRKENSS